MAGNQKGNIILIARGDLLNALDERALGKGELFLATKSYGTTSERLKSKEIYDVSGGKKVRIKRIDEGDIFAGTNTQDEVYCLGGSGALKWGGISGAETYVAAKEAAQANPNRIYMYVGSTSLNADAYAKQGAAEELGEIKDKYVANYSSEYAADINPGDLFFYSPQMEQVVVIHLNHSTDALTKINVDQIVSNSMRTILSANGGNGTLKDFLDGPARHFQYLEDTYGWVPLTTVADAAPRETASDPHSVRVIDFSTIDKKFINDGEVFYIPFNKGLNTYRIKNGESAEPLNGLQANEIFYEGDLLIALPAATVDGKVVRDSSNSRKDAAGDTAASGVVFAHVSLYGGLVTQLIPATITRADPYATFLWGVTTAQQNDKDFVSATDAATGDLLNGIKEYIERLYKTKVDIDPKTGKIISSQLPDFLLSAPKYMGTATKLGTVSVDDDGKETQVEYATAGDAPSNLNAKSFYKYLNNQSYKNFDDNEDEVNEDDEDLQGPDGVDSKDTEMRVGSYWIWQGDPLDITKFPGVFKVDEGADDLLTTSVEVTDSDSADSTEGKDRTNKQYSVSHVLNKGDWIIFDGEKFDIIDNTSNFVGLLVNGSLMSGLVNLKDKDRQMSYYDYTTGTNKNTGLTPETELKVEDTQNLEIGAPAAVLFKDTGTSKVDDNHLPTISASGLAHNSRFELLNRQKGLKLNKITGSGTETSLIFGKYTDTSIPLKDSFSGWDAYEKQYDIRSYWDSNVNHKVSVDILDGSNNDVYAEGFDFNDFLFQENNTTGDADDIYKFTIENVANPQIYLPSTNGVLVTDNYVNYGFAVIKQVIDDMYEAVVRKMTAGHEDWLQTIVEYKDEEGNTREKIFDSKVKQSYTEGTKLVLDLFVTMPTLDSDDEYRNNGLSTKLTALKNITPSNLNTDQDGLVPGKDGYNVNYKLKKGSGYELLNPSEMTGDVENILPNHSGMLLNNNSVIDGGEW